MNNRIIWLVIILSAFTIGFSSCAKDTEVVDPYANWKEKNEQFLDSIADVASNPPSGEIWRKYANYKIKFDDQINNTIKPYEYKVYDYVYVKYASEDDIVDLSAGAEPLINYSDTVSVAYQGFLINGTRFDGNYYGTFDKDVNDNFTSFGVSQVVVGWTTALMNMKPEMNDIATLYIPYQMGYGETGSGSTIKGYSTLIFELYIDKVIHPEVDQ
ncbi:FKBP-type peptidyl-prolyl cis-trans isomerase [Bacteroides caecigallinarum]|uniref:FKBP-type peptidyl-prolyl cis-trans isomerase n=1 Tax=Bacteroides caecigallinarum TaxID=1411144 RepID=UPI001F25E0A2|nr:FKBP-type peptidyl-prolyl cis-trans isomerase [Bacteroides caecigallinarum]MCF2593634.1 FKBP-type peptidyl-prolyl cis-trans isomerase [Bacteroides caecigallinarum]